MHSVCAPSLLDGFGWVRRMRLTAVSRLVVSGVLLALVMTIGVSLNVRDLHTKSQSDAQQQLGNLAAVLADQADRALQAIELVQDAMIGDLRDESISTEADFAARMSEPRIHEQISQRITALPQLNALAVIDAKGKLLNFSRYWPIPDVNVSDRDYFQALSGGERLDRFIGSPVQNRGDGAWTLYMARRFSAPDGTFLGLVLGAVELAYFEHLYSQISPEDTYAISMFREDGVLLVRHPRQEGVLGRRFLNTGGFSAALGATRRVSPIDGQDRFVAARSLGRYPIVVSVTRTVAASLASWRDQAVVTGIVTLMLLLGLTALVELGVRQIRTQRALGTLEAARSAAEERERGEGKLLNQYVRFGTALDNMSQGLCMFGRQDELVVMNERFAEMYDVPASLREQGTPARAIVAFLAATSGGTVSTPMTRALHVPGRAPLEASQAFCEFNDGCTVRVDIRPVPDGGWVCTHEDVTQHRRNEAQISYLARHDTLTGLPNRTMLKEHLEQVLARMEPDRAAAVLVFDLVRFKQINDAFGHDTGDELLRSVAERFRDHLGKTDFLARLGVDEFAVVQESADQPGGANQLAERLAATITRPFAIAGQRILIGTEVGVAVADSSTQAASELLQNADIALHRAKASGRGTPSFFHPSMDEEIKTRRSLEADLRRALAEKQFEVHYQPLVAARTRAITGFEALVRWRHPERGLVSPAEFIPICEEIGLISPLGAWVLETACMVAADWPAEFKIAVNLSPAQFSIGDLVGEVRHALSMSGLAPHRLELEITETVLLQDNDVNLGVLERLHGLGVRIAMDDFGTGYASLSYLRRFPFDKIKIDQSFVRDLDAAGKEIEIIRAIVSLGEALGTCVLAEGVETEEQFDVLVAEGCDEVQGYLFSRPKPIQAFAGLIRSYGGTSSEQVRSAA